MVDKFKCVCVYQGDTFFNQRKNSHRTQKLQEQQQTRPIDSRDKTKEEATVSLSYCTKMLLLLEVPGYPGTGSIIYI